jgi:hypothetical protein
MIKEDIKNEVDFFDYCYENAKKNVINNWNLSKETTEELDLNFPLVLKEFNKMFDLKNMEELEKYYSGERLEKEKSKALKSLKNSTKIFTARIEYLITRRLIH